MAHLPFHYIYCSYVHRKFLESATGFQDKFSDRHTRATQSQILFPAYLVKLDQEVLSILITLIPNTPVQQILHANEGTATWLLNLL